MVTALGLVLSGVIGLAALAAPTIASAAACKTDATEGCEREGLACNPPAGGKCTTVKTPVPLSAPILSCKCLVPPPPKSRSLLDEPPDPCSSPQAREQFARTHGAQALRRQCGNAGPRPSNSRLPPGLHPLNPQPLPPG
jgi:hypothetical protein